MLSFGPRKVFAIERSEMTLISDRSIAGLRRSRDVTYIMPVYMPGF